MYHFIIIHMIPFSGTGNFAFILYNFTFNYINTNMNLKNNMHNWIVSLSSCSPGFEFLVLFLFVKFKFMRA